MSIQSPLKLFVGGCSMITSCSVWLFETSNNPLASAMTLDSTSSPKPINLDKLPAVNKLPKRIGKPIKDPNVEVVNPQRNASITLRFKQDPKITDAILTPINVEIKEFRVFAGSTKTQYQEFEKETIKISLFKKPAWYSESKKEEYELLEHSKVLELFKGNNEVKVKQLLLALSHRVEWEGFGGNNSFYLNWYFANNLSDLKNLKIRHFSDFDKLSEYVKEKTATCVDDTKSCVPHIDELDYLEMDRKDYMEKFWSKQ